jgi:hypothetical protein
MHHPKEIAESPEDAPEPQKLTHLTKVNWHPLSIPYPTTVNMENKSYTKLPELYYDPKYYDNSNLMQVFF